MSSSAAVVSASPGGLAAGSPSPGARPSSRKKNLSRSLAESADGIMPVRSSIARENDPSLMVAGTVELAEGGDSMAKRASVSRSSAKPVSQATENLSAKPKLLKVSLQADKPSASRGAKAASRSHLPKNLFSWYFISFILVAGLATTFWSWKAPSSSLHATTIGGQVAELEEILRKTTKMMQVQLDLVDMKIHKEIEILRKDLEEKIDEQSTTFGTELRNMWAKTEDIEALLKGLMDDGFPSKQDVLSLISTVVDERAAEGNGKAFSLDDVRAVARHLVEIELDKHSSDGIGRVDFALGTGGGKVVDHSKVFYHGLKFSWHQLGSLLSGASNQHSIANKILEPSFGEPGQCLPLQGSNVYVEIALRTSIYPDAFSLEHVSKSAAYDVSSAPKEFRVFGWLDCYKKDNSALKSTVPILLGEYIYDIDKRSVQTFSVLQDSIGKLVNTVRLEVLSNYGSPSHTCIYRFRVHGSDSISSTPVGNEELATA